MRSQAQFWRKISQSNYLSSIGRFRSAAECLKGAIEGLPVEERHPDLFLKRAEVSLELAQNMKSRTNFAESGCYVVFARAAEDFAHVFAMQGKGFKALFGLAQCQYHIGLFENCYFLLEQAEKCAETSCQLFDIFFLKSRASLPLQLYGKCIHYSSLALNEQESHPYQRAQIFFIRAVAYNQRGYFGRALADIDQAIKILPRNRDFQKFRESLLKKIFPLEKLRAIKV